MKGNGSSSTAQLPLMEVLSHGGTSQYTAGGPSACGLASVHAALLVLSLFDNASSIQEALDEIQGQEFIERIMYICSLWTHEGHLDVDDVLALPIFATTLGTLSVEGNWCDPKNFHALYKSLQHETSTVAIITRPPEIVALFNILSGDPKMPFIRILFDSHPRPHLHPNGAAFIFFFDEEGPVKYLSSLFETDKSLVESRTWDASLLGQYTAHVLKLKIATQSDTQLAFYHANIRILEEQANLRAATTRETTLSEENASLRQQMTVQQQRMDRAMEEETASREELDRLRREVERLERTTAHDQIPGAWVEPVSRWSGTPPQESSTTTHDYELALSLQNGYAKRAALDQSDGGRSGHSKSSSIYDFRPFNGKPSSNRSEKKNQNRDAHANERVRQQSTHEEMSRRKGKGRDTLTSSWPEPPAYQTIVSPFPPSTTTDEGAARARALQAQLDSEQASYDLARQLQAQDDDTLWEHQQLVREAARVKMFDCVICMETLSEDYSAPVRSCGHILCRTCMKEHVQSQVDQAIWPVLCPTCVADNSRKERKYGVITRDLVETLGIDEAVLVKWVKLEMDTVSVAVECPSCRKTAPVDVTDFREATDLSCPRGCGAHWCKQCNRTFTRGWVHSCDGQAEFDQLLGQNNWKKCPACGVPVEKTHGCNHMTCRCHCHFCYVCGGVMRNYTNPRNITAHARFCQC